MSQKLDYLKEDAPFPNQKYVCLSIITPETVKSVKKQFDVRAVKVRGVFDTYEEAVERAKFLQSVDPKHNVYVGEVGKWLPWCDDPEKAKDSEYAEPRLNKLMKAHHKNQEKAKMLHEKRKNDMVDNALREQLARKKKKKKKKKKNKEMDRVLKKTHDTKLRNAEERLDDVKQVKETVDLSKEQLEVKKSILDQERSKLAAEQDKVNKIRDELTRLREKYDEATAGAK